MLMLGIRWLGQKKNTASTIIDSYGISNEKLLDIDVLSLNIDLVFIMRSAKWVNMKKTCLKSNCVHRSVAVQEEGRSGVNIRRTTFPLNVYQKVIKCKVFDIWKLLELISNVRTRTIPIAPTKYWNMSVRATTANSIQCKFVQLKLNWKHRLHTHTHTKRQVQFLHHIFCFIAFNICGVSYCYYFVK